MTSPRAPGKPPDARTVARHQWDAAFHALIQDDDGKPLADLLRGSPLEELTEQDSARFDRLAEDDQQFRDKMRDLNPSSIEEQEALIEQAAAKIAGSAPPVRRALIPLEAVYALAELLDPQISWSPYAKPRAPTGQIQIVDGRPRLKAAIEVEAAGKTLMAECERLVKIHNKPAKRGRDKLEASDMVELEEFAQKCDDQAALDAFSGHRKALDKLTAAKDSTNNGVRLTITPLTTEQRAHLARDGRIVAEMLHRAE